MATTWPLVITGNAVLDGFICIFAVCFILINFIAVYAGVSTYAERKIAGHMQARVGPYRIWWHGFGVWIADALKLMIKEDIIAKDTDRLLFKLSPYVVFAGSFACWVALPFIPGWSPANFNIGILYLLAVSSAVVIGILMAGWSSGSNYPLLGSVRSSAQMISYEVGMALAIVAVVMYSDALRMSEIVASQDRIWNVIPQFPAFVIYLIAGLAETNRPPFDLPEAESELVAGYHTEYSGIKFAMFYLGEYLNTVTVAAVATTLWLGGWRGPAPDVLPWLWPLLWFLLKVLVIVYVYIWIRATLPRIRYDRLMAFGWKRLIPFGLLWVMLTGAIVVLPDEFGRDTVITAFAIGFGALVVISLVWPLIAPRASEEVPVP